MDFADGGGEAPGGRRYTSALWELERMGPRSVGGDVRVGQDIGDRGVWAYRESNGAASDWLSDESDLCGCGAGAASRGEGIERGISRDGELAGEIGLCELACAAFARDARVV